MKRKTILTLMVLVCCLIFAMPVAAADANANVTVTVEKFTLGQGYIVEPVIVTVPDGTSAAQVICDLLGGGNYKNTGSIEQTIYIARIKDQETPANVPQFIIDQLAKLGKSLKPRNYSQWLSEFDYYKDSGWMYCVNGVFPGVSASDKELHDGDVMRWQFTIYGYGSDLGADNRSWGGKAPIAPPTDKDVLTTAIAVINGREDKAAFLAVTGNQAIYNDAIGVLTNLESSQADIDAATAAVKAMPESVTPAIDAMTDISQNHWARDAIAAVMERKLFAGVTPTTFAPESNMTRAMFVTVLSRLTTGDISAYKTASKFDDVKQDAWYAAAVNWAAEKGIVNGVTATSFAPDASVTREQMAKMLVEYATYDKIVLPVDQGSANPFTDAGEIGAWAVTYVDAAQKAGLIKGYPDGSFKPANTAVRAEVATIFARMLPLLP